MKSEEGWETHCQQHFKACDIPFRCDPHVFRYGTACAGYCPVHLSNTDLPAHKRLQQYMTRQDWLRHVSNCLTKYAATPQNDAGTFNCPHHLCDFVRCSREDLIDHLNEIHSIPTDLGWADGNSQTSRKRKRTEILFRIKTPVVSSLQSASPAKNTDDCNAMERIAQPSNSSRSEEDIAMVDSSLFCAAWEDPNADIKDMMIDPELYKVTKSDEFAAEASEMHIGDSNSYEASLPDDDYDAQSLLAKYKHGRTMIYLVKWNDGSTTWEPKTSILKQSLIDELETGYKGFNKGIKVIETRTKSKKIQYRVQFLKYAGVETDEFWWVDEGIMDPEAIRRYKAEEEGGKAL